MRRDLAIIARHGVVVAAIIIVEVVLQGAIHYGIEATILEKDIGDYASKILSFFLSSLYSFSALRQL